MKPYQIIYLNYGVYKILSLFFRPKKPKVIDLGDMKINKKTTTLSKNKKSINNLDNHNL